MTKKEEEAQEKIRRQKLVDAGFNPDNIAKIYSAADMIELKRKLHEDHQRSLGQYRR